MQSHTVPITQVDGFDVHDFLARWEKARLSALLGFFTAEERLKPGFEASSEDYLLGKCDSFDRDQLLKRVFDQSRKFGLSASRHTGLSFETVDVKEILESSRIPCLNGVWVKHNSAYINRRNGCASFRTYGSLACDYWREALDGLVMGVGENERLARHRSLGHGDSECLDILFTENFKAPRLVRIDSDEKQKIDRRSHYGEIPDEMKERFGSITEKFKRMKVDLILDGFSEGRLFYRLEPEKGVLCGAGGKLMHDNFSREAKRLYPHLLFSDASPLAVYGGSS